MLTKYKDVRSKKGVKSPQKMFSSLRHIQKFFQGAPNFDMLLNVFFSTELFQIVLRIKEALRGSGGMLPWKILENLHTVVAI